MPAEVYIVTGTLFIIVAIYRSVVVICNFVEMRYSANCVEDLKFNIMRLFLEQQNILSEMGVRMDFRLHNNKFFDKITQLYEKMYDAYVYVSPDVNTRLRSDYVARLKQNYEDNINSINTTIILLNSYSCRHNYARDCVPGFLCDSETQFVENIDPRRDHGICGTAGGLI